MQLVADKQYTFLPKSFKGLEDFKIKTLTEVIMVRAYFSEIAFSHSGGILVNSLWSILKEYSSH